ncbi:autotransporter outer membrane beta-barrel domain-containing protein [Bartonella sp. B30(2025)]
MIVLSALFSAGFADVSHQSALLDDTRAAISKSSYPAVFGEKDNEKQGIFFSAYGNNVTLSSSRTPLQYGYGADVHYAALQAGITLTAFESQDISANLGLLGTYGKLAFTPKNIEDASESKINKWSVAAYGSIKHENGVYVNALLSYGLLKGNITTALNAKAADINQTKALSASATVGKKLETGAEGLVFEPQAQLVYQNLIFDLIQDVDGFKVDFGNPHQWLIRVGGYLTQTVSASEDGHAVAFYGKLNATKAFGGNQTVKIGDTFHLDTTGSSVEGGIGAHAKLSWNLILHGDVSYQYKIQVSRLLGLNFFDKYVTDFKYSVQNIKNDTYRLFLVFTKNTQ